MILNQDNWHQFDKKKQIQIKLSHKSSIGYNGKTHNLGNWFCLLEFVSLSGRHMRALVLIRGYQTFLLSTLSQMMGLASWVAAQDIHLDEVLKQQWKYNKREMECLLAPGRKSTICDLRVSSSGYWVRFPRSMLKIQQMEDKPFSGEGLCFTTELLFC